MFCGLQSCSLDPSSSIAQRVTKEKEEYVRHFKRIMGSPSGSVARSRFQIGVRLYYRVMASMLKRVRVSSVVGFVNVTGRNGGTSLFGLFESRLGTMSEHGGRKRRSSNEGTSKVEPVVLRSFDDTS